MMANATGHSVCIRTSRTHHYPTRMPAFPTRMGSDQDCCAMASWPLHSVAFLVFSCGLYWACTAEENHSCFAAVRIVCAAEAVESSQDLM